MQYKPAVFAVENEYQILVPVTKPSLMWVRVGEQCFYDHANGVLRSKCKVHHMTVPAAVLEEAGGYTVCERRIPHRSIVQGQTPLWKRRLIFIPCRARIRARI